MPPITRLAAAALVALVVALALVAAPRSGPADAQDDAEERIVALDTRLFELENRVIELDTRVGELESRVAGLETWAGDVNGRLDRLDGLLEAIMLEAGAPPRQGTFADPVPLGQEAEIGPGWTMRVVGAIPDATDLVLAANRFNEPPAEGRQFVLVTVAITNASDAPQAPASVVGFSAVGRSQAYDPDGDGCGVIPDDLLGAEVFPVGTTEGDVCFAVAAADVDPLVLCTTNRSTGRAVCFALR